MVGIYVFGVELGLDGMEPPLGWGCIKALISAMGVGRWVGGRVLGGLRWGERGVDIDGGLFAGEFRGDGGKVEGAGRM